MRDKQMRKRKGQKDPFGNIPFENIESIICNIKECCEANNYQELLKNLLELADIIKAISPEVASDMGKFLDNYGTAIRPVTDQLITEIIKAANYYLEMSTRVMEETFIEKGKEESARAKSRYQEFDALINAGFHRDEAMAIVLAEISKEKPNNILDYLSDYKSKKEEMKEEEEKK